jgi:hypothetical protein
MTTSANIRKRYRQYQSRPGFRPKEYAQRVRYRLVPGVWC